MFGKIAFAGVDPGFSRRGPSFGGPKVANIIVAKRSCTSEASYMQPGSRDQLRALEALTFSVFKYSFFHILETLFLSFLTLVEYQKLIKLVHCSSINLRYFYVVT